jgi:hypothetical protein
MAHSQYLRNLSAIIQSATKICSSIELTGQPEVRRGLALHQHYAVSGEHFYWKKYIEGVHE